MKSMSFCNKKLVGCTAQISKAMDMSVSNASENPLLLFYYFSYNLYGTHMGIQIEYYQDKLKFVRITFLNAFENICNILTVW